MTDDSKENKLETNGVHPDKVPACGYMVPNSWKLLIVDDEEEVHKLTRMVLDDYVFEGRGLTFLSAYSGEEAKRMMVEHPDTALVLLDVVMETDDAGLMVVKHIREDLKNSIVQIVLRTGQPGMAPQQEAIARYDINDYKSKVELTADKMYTTITASLRAYRLTASLHQLNLQLQKELAERRRAEEQIRRLIQFQENIIDNADIWLCVMDDRGRVLVWNRAAERLSGYDRAEMLKAGKIWDKLFPDPVVRKKTIEDFLRVIRDNRKFDGLENPITRKDGRSRIMAWNVKRLADGQGETIGATILGRDVTDRHVLESQFRQSQKMEAIGRLAGGIAHDFNNILTVVRGYCDLSRINLNPRDPFYTRFIQIDRAAGRGEQLTRQLLAFSRQQIIKPKTINLSALIDDMQKMLRRMIGEEVEFVVRLEEHIGHIKADPGQIEQVVMNLAVNARDAMPGGGVLVMETGNETLMPAFGKTGERDYVVLRMTDTGSGMDAETKEKIFEPFFTTKEEHKGTGLGLSTVFGIVNQSKGHITVESEVGGGSTFRIYFPRVDKPVHRESVKAESSGRPGGSETILVVEDQPEVLRLATETLRTGGYHVLAAADADSALLTWEENREAIDLLLTDIVMPRMNGVQLAKRLKGSRPDLKILFMSGYANSIVDGHEIIDPDHNFIQKPFTATDLLRRVRHILDTGERPCPVI